MFYKNVYTPLILLAVLSVSAQVPDERRCGTLDPNARQQIRDAADCSGSLTNPTPNYDPGAIYTIPVVVHIITDTDGTTGNLTNEMVQSQIDILNEDFGAFPGTNGAPGVDTGIRFELATIDPDGNPTNGITRTANASWFVTPDGTAAEMQMKQTLGWDESRYLNLYTNSPGGSLLGWAYFPFWEGLGGWEDGVVILYTSFGRNSPGGNYSQGRTATHEVGHWLGLLHTFQGGCGNAAQPYTTGDLLEDTEPEAFSTSGCPTNKQSCGSRDPVENYMDYSWDLCMDRFTLEQARRMRCSIESYRPAFAVASASISANMTLLNTGDNEAADPGESLTARFTLLNSGVLEATGISAELSSDNQNINITSANSNYPNLAPTASSANQTDFTFIIDENMECGVNFPLHLDVTFNDGTRAVTTRRFSFAIQTGVLQGYDQSVSPGTAIPDANPTGITSQLVVNDPDAGNVTGGFTVSVNITHTYRGDLELELTSPQGTTVVLKNDGNDAADDLIGVYPTTLTPEESLAAFVGQPLNGTWSLRVADNVGDDTGTLNSWGISDYSGYECDASSCAPPGISNHPGDMATCEGSAAAFSVTPSGSGPFSYLWQLDGETVPNSNVATLTIESVGAEDFGTYQCFITNSCGIAVSQSAVLSSAGGFQLSVPNSIQPMGLGPITLAADLECPPSGSTWAWTNLSNQQSYGNGVNPVVLNPAPTQTTTYQFTLTNGQEMTSETVTVLVPQNADYLDVDGDGCNTINDWQMVLPQWGTTSANDPNGDGIFNLLDLFYIDTSDPFPCD